MLTPTLHPSPPIREDTLGDIKSRISELLESEVCQQQSKELQDQLTRFQEALEAKSEKAGYDHKDYEQRLFREEDKLESILEQDQALRVLYKNILRAIEFAPYLKQALWGNLLFDRVLELGPPPQEFPESVTVSYNELKTGDSIPPYIIIKDFPTQPSPNELEEVFLKIENAPGVLAIDLTDNNLGTFRKDQLQAIFSHLGNMKRINLWNNSLGKLDEPSIQAIFSHLGNVRSIDLGYNDLCKIDPSRLQTIFSHLGNVRSLNLWENDLGQLDEPRLQAIFSHLGNVRSMDLSWNNLGQLDASCLQAMFSHLGGVRSLNLCWNDLYKLDEPRLQAIFSHLVHIEEVILVYQKEGSMLESLFPSLKGKIKIV